MATLKNLVDETTNIKNELVECHSNLKNNLIEKGVECSNTDKMSSLIDKVGNITGYRISDTITEAQVTLSSYDASTVGNKYATTITTYCEFNPLQIDGVCYVSIYGKNNSTDSSFWGTLYVYINGKLSKTFQFNSDKVYWQTCKITANVGDIVSLRFKTLTTGVTSKALYLGDSKLICYLDNI